MTAVNVDRDTGVEGYPLAANWADPADELYSYNTLCSIISKASLHDCRPYCLREKKRAPGARPANFDVDAATVETALP